jgi:hypothetical protein
MRSPARDCGGWRERRENSGDAPPGIKASPRRSASSTVARWGRNHHANPWKGRLDGRRRAKDAFCRRPEISEPIPCPSLGVRTGRWPTLRDETGGGRRTRPQIPCHSRESRNPGGHVARGVSPFWLRRRAPTWAAASWRLDTRFRDKVERRRINMLAVCFSSAKRSKSGAAVRLSGLLPPRVPWPLDRFVAMAPRNDEWGAADPIDSAIILVRADFY